MRITVTQFRLKNRRWFGRNNIHFFIISGDAEKILEVYAKLPDNKKPMLMVIMNALISGMEIQEMLAGKQNIWKTDNLICVLRGAASSYKNAGLAEPMQ